MISLNLNKILSTASSSYNFTCYNHKIKKGFPINNDFGTILTISKSNDY